jgi:hypothetical protein
MNQVASFWWALCVSCFSHSYADDFFFPIFLVGANPL